MKYCMIIPEGMSDVRYPSLNNKTPLEAADTVTIKRLAEHSRVGIAQTIPELTEPTSVAADLSVLSYIPDDSYKVGPYEAIGAGVPMTVNDIAYRCSLVTVTEKSEVFSEQKIIDYSAGEITTEESTELFNFLNTKINVSGISFWPSNGFRGIFKISNSDVTVDFPSPHDITGSEVGRYLSPSYIGKYDFDIIFVLSKCYELLKNHPINISRKEKGLRPANALWIWSGGAVKKLPSFENKFGISGSIIAADNLIKGIGISAGMSAPSVKGATGNLVSDFSAKADAAIKQFKAGTDFVCVHIEATDECGHHGNPKKKSEVIERVDKEIVSPIYEYLSESGDDYRIMILSNVSTPCNARVHTVSPIPYLIFKSDEQYENKTAFSEYADCGDIIKGTELMNILVENTDTKKQKNENGTPSKAAVAIFDWIELFACAMVCVILILTFALRHSPVWGSSMYPTLIGKSEIKTEYTVTKGYDVLVVSNVFYKPTKGDIVVIQEPTQPTEPIVKRIIGTSGDKIKMDFTTWKVYVNGNELDEPYINYLQGKPLSPQKLITDSNNCWEGTVPEGCVFVLGDNRYYSKDSRSFGFIDERYVIGKVVLRVLPFNRFGKAN